MKRLSKYWHLIFLGFFAFLTRFWNLFYPPNVVFDEAHFGLYAAKYISGQYYFDIHPPLGKMLYALVGWFAKIKPGFYFAVNSFYKDFNYIALRILPALVGSFFILLIYFFCKKIGLSTRAAFLSSFLLLFNNALVVESRLILINIFLLFFIFLALFIFVLVQKSLRFSKKWYLLNFLCGIFLGAAGSIKWPGFGAMILVLFLTFFRKKLSKKEALIKIGFFVLIPILFYLFIFYLHFSLLPFECYENCGQVLDDFSEMCSNCNFFTKQPESSSFLAKLAYVHVWMFHGNFSFGGGYSYGSNWWSWPLMIRSMPYFFQRISETTTSYIYLIGNPIAWWLGTLGVIGYSFLLFFTKVFKRKILNINVFPSILIAGYFLFWLAFIFIGRFVLLYLYFPALVFSSIIFSVLLDAFLRKRFNLPFNGKIFFQNKKANLILALVLILVVAGFLFFSPLTYGASLTEQQFNSRMWDDILWGIIPNGPIQPFLE